MPRRDLLDDAPLHQFVGNFAPCPLADGSSRLHRRFTCKGRYLTTLLRRELRRGSWSRCILQALCYTERLQVDSLQSHPAIAPQAHGIHVQHQLSPNLRIRVSLRRR
jgi:hypothetical protein